MTNAHATGPASWRRTTAILAIVAALSACAPAPSGGGTETPGPSVRGSMVPQDQLTPSGQVTSESDGQVIEELDIQGGIKVMHDDVTVRNLRILQTSERQGHYALVVTHKKDGSCPENVVVENIEVTGAGDELAPGTKAVYGECPFTLRSSIVHHVASAVRITSNTVIENNDILADHWVEGDDAHRSGIGLNGGAHNVIRGNTITCEGPGCSAALAMYGSNEPVEDILVEDNIFATTGSYCVYAGSLDSKPFPVAKDVRFINNTFSRQFSENCGQFGPVAGRDSDGGPGFVWQGNVWDDTGEEVLT